VTGNKELLLKALRNEATPRPAWLPFVGAHGAKMLETSAEAYFQSADLIAQGLRKANELYKPDGLPIVFDLQMEAEVLGCRLKWAKEAPPSVVSHPLAEGKLADLPTFDVSRGRYPVVKQALQTVKQDIGEQTALYGLITGPWLGILQPSRDLGELLRPLIQIGVAIILFEGGLSLKLHELEHAASGVRRLVLPGVPLAWALGTVAAFYVGGLSWEVAFVFGAIIVVTGPTVIIPLLRQARLRQRTASLLKWEAIVNDPIGALLGVVVFEFLVIVSQGGEASDLFVHFF